MGGKGPIRRQFYSSICGNLLTASYGSSLGWISANFLELQKPDTKFPSGPLSLKEATLVMSMAFIGGIAGNLVFPHIVRKFGCKRLMLANGIPSIIIWLLIIYAQNPYYLYAASVLCGSMGTGHIICMSIFVTEIADDKIRGTLNSLLDPAFNLGILLSFVLPNFFDYATQAKYHLILAIVYIILFAGIPDSPQYLVNTQKKKAADKAHRFYKGTELESLQVTAPENIKQKSGLHLSDFTNRRARKAMYIAFSLMILIVLRGTAILVSYVTEIFSTINPNISPYNASVMIIIIIIIGNIIFINLVDRAGRRTFFVCSSFGATFGLIIFAFYLYYLTDNHAYDWVPIVCVSCILFVSCLGMRSIPFIVVMEIFPKEIKQYGYSNCILLLLLGEFVFTGLYPPIKVYIGLFGWIVFFAAMSLCNALFGIFFLPETRGKSYDEIMQILDR